MTLLDRITAAYRGGHDVTAPAFNPLTDLPPAYGPGLLPGPPVATEVTREQFVGLAILNGWPESAVRLLAAGRMPPGVRVMGRLRLTVVGDDS